LDTLPEQITFSTVSIPLSGPPSGSGGGEIVKLYKRDLADAKFQLMSNDTLDEGVPPPGADPALATSKDSTSALDLLSAPSDLIPGVYEGGFRVWECSLDLVDYLAGNGRTSGDVPLPAPSSRRKIIEASSLWLQGSLC
jgi:protein-histidine N-methyltransferase